MSAIMPAAVAATPEIFLDSRELSMEKFDQILRQVPSDHFYSSTNLRRLLDKYNETDLKKIYKDFLELKDATFEGVSQKRDYLVTAGAPTSGKSTILENLIEGKGDCPDECIDKEIKRAYIDPDRSCLFRMEQTYLADVASKSRTPQESYEHWRNASNFLSNVFLAIALKEGYAVAHGSTMATPSAIKALEHIKNQYRYTITLVHMNADETVREKSEKSRRDRGIYQCTDEDFRDKKDMFLTLLPNYLTAADTVLFCYRDGLKTSKWAAKIANKELTIYDDKAFEKIKNLHTQKIVEEALAPYRKNF